MEKITSENICKIIILESSQQRLFHPKLQENFLQQENLVRRKRPSVFKKCLFGKSDPDDTKRMLEEQYGLDQQRFFSRFGFDIETIEQLERTKDDVKENIENDRNEQNRKSCSAGIKNLGKKILKARRKVSFNKPQTNQSQQFITDYYQARKNSALHSLGKNTPTEQPTSNLENC
ncbi:unnamed protein product [Ceutorhynchus assimilis]|uniref:Uncharacterized protein n=1 Tax=Ceutorhynchus assimilis TaxID=467358 RepID=A0A9N9MI21_9CUCU|nr:unnamed protein product [Ceutorhynchus assimilis]